MDMPAPVRPYAHDNDNSWSAHVRATLALGIPLIGAQLAQLGINTTDVMIVGRLGAEQLAAMVLSAQFLFTILVFGSGFSIAVMPLVAQAYGRGDVTSVRRALRMGLWVVTAYWLLAQPAFFYSEEILLAAGQKPDVAKLASGYIDIGHFAVLPGLLYNVIRALVSAIGRAGIILKVTIAMLVMNAVLAYILVLGHFGLPAMGLVGSGLGSTITWLILCGAMIAFVLADRRFRRFHLFGNWWRLDRQRMIEMVRLGWPIGATMALEIGVFALAAYFMGWIGAPAVAGHAVALQLAALTFMVPLGLGQAATVRVGLALGRSDEEGITRAGWTAWIMGLGFMATMALVMWTIPHRLVILFLADVPQNAEVIALAVSFLKVAAAFQLVDGAQVIGAGMLRGLHDTRWPLVFAVVGYWIVGLGIGSWLAFAADWKGLGIWVGLASGLASVAVLMLARWLMRGRLGLTRLAHS